MAKQIIFLVLLLIMAVVCRKELPSPDGERREETREGTKTSTKTDSVAIVVNKPEDALGLTDANIFCWFEIRDQSSAYDLIRIARAVNINQWPQSNVRRTAPLFDVSLLDRPTRASRVTNSLWFLPLRDGVWGYQDWHGDDGAGRKNWLWVRIYLSPHSQAAHEICMLGTMTPLPAESWIWHYSRASGPNDIGDLAFDIFSSDHKDRTVEFFRDNVYFKIRGAGVFVDEVLPLARKLDKLIQLRLTLTYVQLLARRPKIAIHDFNPNIRTRFGSKALRYTSLSPTGTRIIRTHAKINDSFASATDGLINVGTKVGRINVELTVISSELLASTIKREIFIPP